jgi:hypothetical protein
MSEATRAKELAGLIERVEAATGGHGEAATDLRREIEYRIVSLLISPQEAFLHEIHGIADYRVTTSVDAALALVERVLTGRPDQPTFSLDHASLGANWTCEFHWFINPAWHSRADMPTAPLALLRALHRALQESQDAQ